jgi:hypothetical protein
MYCGLHFQSVRIIITLGNEFKPSLHVFAPTKTFLLFYSVGLEHAARIEH